MKKVVLGFSGGVDSAVCSVLLKRDGYEVIGVYLDNSGAAELEAAVSGAEAAGIRLEVIDVKADLEENVCRPFAESYLRGETPNPCILCNPTVKFRHLLAAADMLGAEHIATGHYARTEGGCLYKGHSENDQSYLLCRITRQQLSRLILPLGAYPKREVRAMAEEFGLPVAHKPDSMEICFIPDKNYIRWLSERTALPCPGAVVLHGTEIGRHNGIHCFTVGQRYPGLIDGRKVYISRIRAEENVIELAWWEELFTCEVEAKAFNALCDLPEEFTGSVRVRHTKWENPPCTARLAPDGSISIRCDEPVRAPAAGQSAVLYKGEQVLGGGFIVHK